MMVSGEIFSVTTRVAETACSLRAFDICFDDWVNPVIFAGLMVAFIGSAPRSSSLSMYGNVVSSSLERFASILSLIVLGVASPFISMFF